MHAISYINWDYVQSLKSNTHIKYLHYYPPNPSQRYSNIKLPLKRYYWSNILIFKTFLIVAIRTVDFSILSN